MIYGIISQEKALHVEVWKRIIKTIPSTNRIGSIGQKSTKSNQECRSVR